MYTVTATFQAIDRVSSVAASIGQNVEGLSGRLTKAGQAMMSTGMKMTASITAPIVGLGVAAAKAAIDVESAFAGVVKTTDGLVDEMGQLNQVGEELKQGFRDLAKEIPMPVEELMKIGEIGGQLGIAKDQLLGFTETIAALGVTTNMTTDEAANALARISNIYAVGTEDMASNVEHLGSSIVALGNNFATTEQEIANFALRIAGAGTIAGLTQDQVLAIGAAMSSVGVQAEAGGTAVQKVLLSMNAAVTGTGQAFVDNSKAIGQLETKLMSLSGNLVRYEAQTGMTAGQMRELYNSFIAAGGSAEEFGRQLGDSGRQKLMETILAIDSTKEAMQALHAEQGKPIETGNLETFARVAGMTAAEFKAAWQDDAGTAFQKFVEGLGAAGDDAMGILEELGLQDQRLVRSFLSLANAGDLLAETMVMSGDAWEENSALAAEAALRYATTESQLQLLKNTVKDFLITLGDRFLPIIQEAVTAIRPFIEKIASAPEPVVKLTLAILGIAAAIGPALTIVGALATAFGFLLSPIGLVVAAVAGLALAFATNFGGIRDKVQPVLDWLVGVWDSIVHAVKPFLKILEGMGKSIVDAFEKGGVVGAIEKFKALWPDLKTVVGNALGAIGAVVGPALAQVGRALLAAADSWGYAIVSALSAALGVDILAVFDNLKSKVTEAFAQISSTVQTVWTPIKAVFQSIGDVLGPTLSTAFENLKTAFAGLQPLGESLKGMFEALAPVIGAVVVGAIGLLVGAFNGLVTAVSAAAPYIIQAVTGAVDIIAGVVGGLVDIIRWVVGAVTGDSEAMAAAWESLKSRAATIWEGIKNLVVGSVNGLVNLVLGLVVGFVEGVIGFFTGLYERLVGGSIVPDLVNGIIFWFQSLLAPIQAVWAGIQALTSAVWAAIGEIVSAGMALLRTVVEAGWAAIAGAVEAAIGRITAIVGTLASVVVPVAIAAWETIKSAASTAWEAIQAIVSSAVDAVSDFINDGIRGWESAWNSFKATAEGLWKGLAATISTAWNGLVTTANAAWNKIKSVITAAIQAVISKVQAILSPLTSMRSLFDNIQGAADGLKEGLNRLKKAIDGIKRAIEAALSKLKNFLSSLANAVIPDWLQGHSPSPLENWIRGIGEAFGVAAGSATNWGGAMSAAARNAKETVETVFSAATGFNEAVQAMVEALNTVQGYTAGAMDIGAFKTDMLDIVGAMREAFSQLARLREGQDMLSVDKVSKMVQTIDTVFRMIQTVLDVAASLQAYVSVERSLIQAFADDLLEIVQTIAQTLYSSNANVRMASSILQMIQTMATPIQEAVKGLAALREYTAVGVEAVQAFAADLVFVVSFLQEAASLFAVEGLMAAVQFSASAGAIANAAGEAVEGLKKMEDYGGVSLEAMRRFRADLPLVVSMMEDIATRFALEGVQAAEEFAASAGAIANAAGQAAEGLKKMSDYGGISLEAMRRFRADLPLVVSMMEDIATRFALEGVQAAEEFAASAGAISRAAGDAARGMSTMADYGGVPVEAMERFRADLPMVVAMMEAISAEFAIEGVQAAEEFSASAGAIAQTVGKAVGGLKALAEYGGSPVAAMKRFRSDLANLTRTMAASAQDLVGLDLPGTAEVLGQVAEIASSVQEALRAMEGLAEYEGGIGSGLQAFVSDVELLIAAFEDLRDAIPEWLVPGSPTPLQTGIEGIAGALTGLNGAIADTSGLFALPAPPELFGELPPMGGTEPESVEEHKHYHLDYHGYTKDDPGERSAARVLSELEILTGG